LIKDFTLINKLIKKAPCKKLTFIIKTIKTTSLIMPIRQKLSPLLRPTIRKPRGKVLIVPPE
jgi:hypothetical protein